MADTRAKPRSEIDAPSSTQLETENVEPNLAIPATDKDEPSLEKLRIDTELPSFAKSSRDT